MADKYLNFTQLSYFWNKVKNYVQGVLPTKTSDLTNDSGFITGYTETDPTVPSWAKSSTKPSYEAPEIAYQTPHAHTPLDDIQASNVQEALDQLDYVLSGKQDLLTSGLNIKTVNNESILGNGNISINGLPAVTTSDNGKILKVTNGIWTASNETAPITYSLSISGNRITLTPSSGTATYVDLPVYDGSVN